MKYLQRFRDVLNPIDRTSEILFGLIMAMTILGTISIANAGQQDVRMALIAVLGCNLAWGMVDGVMYLVRTLTGRARNIHLARCVQSADAPTGQQLLRDALPEEIAALAGSNELEAMRQRLLAVPADTVKTLRPDDYIAACAIFLLVLLTSVPLALPFLLIADIQTAMRMYRIVSLFMLFGCGMAFARYAGHARPARVGFAMMVIAAVFCHFFCPIKSPPCDFALRAFCFSFAHFFSSFAKGIGWAGLPATHHPGRLLTIMPVSARQHPWRYLAAPIQKAP